MIIYSTPINCYMNISKTIKFYCKVDPQTQISFVCFIATNSSIRTFEGCVYAG